MPVAHAMRYALGATRFEAISAALYYARTGIVGSSCSASGAPSANHGRDDGDWQQSADLGIAVRAAYTMSAVIANEFTEAADDCICTR